MPKLTKKKFSIGLKIISSFLKPYRKVVFGLIILSIFSAFANAIVPYLAGRIIDSILVQEQIFTKTIFAMQLAVFFVIIWFLVRIIGDIFDWKIDLKRNRLEALVETDYLIKGFSHVIELPLSFHKKHKMGEIGDKINRASDWLARIIGRVIIDVTPRVLSIFIAMFIMFYIKPLLAFILIIAVLIYVAVLIKISPQLSDLIRKTHKAYSKAYGDAYDLILNTQAVKQAIAEKYEEKKLFKGFRLKAVKFWTEYMNIWQRINFSQRLVIVFAQLSIFIISIILINQKVMTIGELVMFNGYAAMLFGPFVILATNWQTIHNGFIALERAQKIFDTPKEIYEPENAVILDKITGGVEFDKVSFSYKEKQQEVLDGVSFKVNPGEIIALVGVSGVGKTTLIDLMSLYFKPTRGRVLIDRHNIKNLDLKSLRAQIAVVPQEIILFNDTVKNNIRYGNFLANDKKVIEAAKKAHAYEFIEKFPQKYNQLVGERGIKLSTGQKQRIAIARAILRNPKILVLDEPTSALDAISEKFVTDALEELMKGRTTFIIAHRLATVRRADRVIVLKDGKIVEEGKHDDLIKIENGVYRKLYELQKL